MVDIDELERLLAAATGGPWAHDPTVVFSDSPELPCVIDASRMVIAQAFDDGRTIAEAETNAALIVAARNSLPAILTEIRELRAEVERWHTAYDIAHEQATENGAHLAELRAENARLREESTKADEPHWFYAEGWEERCLHSPDEAIDLLDFPPGEYVTEVSTARPCPSIWCAVRVNSDEDADERFTFTEHATESDARAALGEPQ